MFPWSTGTNSMSNWLGKGLYWGRGADLSSVAHALYFYQKCNKLCLSLSYSCKIVFWYYLNMHWKNISSSGNHFVIMVSFLLTHSPPKMKSVLSGVKGWVLRREVCTRVLDGLLHSLVTWMVSPPSPAWESPPLWNMILIPAGRVVGRLKEGGKMNL